MTLWMITDVSEWMSISETTESLRLDIVRNTQTRSTILHVGDVRKCTV